jgi:hypothetical protein
LENWGLITRKKEFGGLGVPNLRDMNLCLLGSWFHRFFNGGEKTWKKILNTSTILLQNNCGAIITIFPLSGKGFLGLLLLFVLAIVGLLGLVEESCFG